MATQAEPTVDFGNPVNVVKAPKKQKNYILYAGIFQIVGSTIIMVFSFVLIVARYKYYTGHYTNRFDNSAIGIWGGLFVLITGIIGVRTGQRKGSPVCYFITCLFSIVVLIAILVVTGLAAYESGDYYRSEQISNYQGLVDGLKLANSDDTGNYPDGGEVISRFQQSSLDAPRGIFLTKLVFHILIGILVTAELVTGILVTVFCCSRMCPGDAQEQTVTYHQTTTSQGPEPAKQ